ncbi:hypothetical protein [Nocardia xishanensis]
MAAILRPFRAALVAITALAATLVFAVAGAGAAQAGVYAEIKFAPGTSEATLDGAVVRGDADSYLLEARGGQLLKTAIVALEDNVNFSVSAPDGLVLAVEETWTEIVLPYDGVYRVLVAPTRGNASYTLHVEIH